MPYKITYRMQTTAFLGLLELHGVGGQVIDLNPSTIVTARLPRRADHFGPGIMCYITTTDGKAVGVMESCAAVRRLLEAPR